MAYFYDENPTRSDGTAIDFDRVDAVKAWSKHYANMLMLDFLHANERDGRAAADLRREMQVCQRKMDWWKKKDNWDAERAVVTAEAIKKDWEKKR
jgi:hypothetical protein